jgi:hypothetical protein
MGKIRFLPVFALFILVSVGLIACGSSGGGGGGGGDSDSPYYINSLINGTTVNYDGSLTMGSAITKPIAEPVILSGTTVIFGMKSISGPSSLIIFNGQSTGIYRVRDNDVWLSAMDGDTLAGGIIYGGMKVLYNSSSAFVGVVNVTEYGAIGEAISGSFMVNVSAFVAGGGPSGALSNVSGTFSVEREADDAF